MIDLLKGAERMQGLALAVLAQADRLDVGSEAAPVATDTIAWLADAANLHGRTAHRLVRLAAELDESFPDTARALLSGQIDADHAQVITTGVQALPMWVSADLRRKAEAQLLGDARRLDAIKLRRVAKHLLRVVDPEGAERELAKRVQRDEDDARAHTRFGLWDDGKGLCHGDFILPSLRGEMLRKMVDAIVSPHVPTRSRARRPVRPSAS